MRTVLLFFYKSCATIIGFLAHPYQTTQRVVAKDIPVSLMFFPLLLCFLGWYLARTQASLFLSLVPFVGFWWFLEVWWLLFWGMWQITLLYLYWRCVHAKDVGIGHESQSAQE